MRQSLIAFGDFHLTENKPICRKEKDFIATQQGKLKQIVDLAISTNSMLVCAGDLLDYWKHDGYQLVNMVNGVLAGWTCCGVAGNHELPHHSMDQYYRSPLKAITDFKLLQPDSSPAGFSFGVPVIPTKAEVCVQHRMIYLSDPIHGYEGNKYDVRHEYERDVYKNYRVVITGDNHKPFVYRKDDDHVWVNCGCVYRTSVTEKDYEPSCWQIILDDNTVEIIQHKLAVVTDDVDRTEMYLDRVKDSFVSEFATEVKQQVTQKQDYAGIVGELCDNQPPELTKLVYANIDEAKKEIK